MGLKLPPDAPQFEPTRPLTLGEWLDSRAKPQVILAQLKELGGPTRDSDGEVLALVRANPALIGRVTDLVRAADRAPSTVRDSMIRLGQAVVEGLDIGLTCWLRDESSTTEEDLTRLTSALSPRLRGRDPSDKKVAEQALALGLSVFVAKRRLAPDRVLEAIGDAYGVPAGDGPSDTRPARAVSSLIASGRPRQLAQFAAVQRLQAHRTADAEMRATREATKAADLEARLRKATEEIVRADAASAELRRRSEELEILLAEERGRAQSDRSVGAHDAAGVRARLRRALGEQMLGLAKDARDALEIDPPKPNFAKVYLSDLMEKIEGEIRWLNARSE